MVNNSARLSRLCSALMHSRGINGYTWTVHPEDEGEWRHWDTQEPGGQKDAWPRNKRKPWPSQKKPPKPPQCPVDPSGDTPSWKPPIPSPENTNSDDPIMPFMPYPKWFPVMVPIRVPMPVIP